MLFGDDLVADGHADAGSFADQLGCEERLEVASPDRFGNAAAAVRDRVLNPPVDHTQA